MQTQNYVKLMLKDRQKKKKKGIVKMRGRVRYALKCKHSINDILTILLQSQLWTHLAS